MHVLKYELNEFKTKSNKSRSIIRNSFDLQLFSLCEIFQYESSTIEHGKSVIYTQVLSTQVLMEYSIYIFLTEWSCGLIAQTHLSKESILKEKQPEWLQYWGVGSRVEQHSEVSNCWNYPWRRLSTWRLNAISWNYRGRDNNRCGRVSQNSSSSSFAPSSKSSCCRKTAKCYQKCRNAQRI